MKRVFTRDQRMTIVYGILCTVLVLVVLQLWLLTATMNVASLVCLLLNLGLLRYLYRIERPSHDVD